MIGGKCSLCNGKLDSKKICKECGLDNSKSEKYYKINRSSCDNLPMTHVHEERKVTKNSKKKTETGRVPSSKKAQGEEKDRKKGILSIISALVIFIPAVFGMIGNLIDSDFSGPEPDYSYDPYEYLEAELPGSGETLTYTLKSGQYIVGVHLAEGCYEATAFGAYDSIEVTDDQNGIYLYQYPFDGNDDYMKDMRLFDGAIVNIVSPEGIQFDTENGQAGKMPTLVENFVTDRFVLHSYDEVTAGEDFEPGIYDLSVEEAYSYVSLTVYDEDGSEVDYRSYDIGTDGSFGPYLRNIVIPEGTTVYSEEGDVEFIPSEYIWTTEYMEHYE